MGKRRRLGLAAPAHLGSCVDCVPRLRGQERTSRTSRGRGIHWRFLYRPAIAPLPLMLVQVEVCAPNEAAAQSALEMIELLASDPEPGRIFRWVWP